MANMNRFQLVQELGKRTGFTQGDIDIVIDSMFEIIEEKISALEEVKVSWLTIGGKVGGGIERRNPSTGEPFFQEKHKTIYTKAGVSIKQKLKAEKLKE